MIINQFLFPKDLVTLKLVSTLTAGTRILRWTLLGRLGRPTKVQVSAPRLSYKRIASWGCKTLRRFGGWLCTDPTTTLKDPRWACRKFFKGIGLKKSSYDLLGWNFSTRKILRICGRVWVLREQQQQQQHQPPLKKKKHDNGKSNHLKIYFLLNIRRCSSCNCHVSFRGIWKKATQSFRWNPIKKEDGSKKVSKISGRFHKRKKTTQMRKMLTEICWKPTGMFVVVVTMFHL